MENSPFSVKPFDCNLYGPLGDYAREGGVMEGTLSHFEREENWENFGNICSQYDLSQEGMMSKGDMFSEDRQQSFSDFGMLDDLHFDAVSAPVQPFLESFQSNNGLMRLNSEEQTAPSGGLSTQEIMKMAAARYVQQSYQNNEDFTMLGELHGNSLLDLSDQETKDIELAQLLLASAERVGNKQFERASKLINQCFYFSSNNGTPTERIVYYFANALQGKIDRESGRITPVASKIHGGRWEMKVEERLMSPNPAVLACIQNYPFSQVMQFTSIEAIIEDTASAKKVHIIDLGIKIGVQWTVLMQGLAAAKPNKTELLKITAVGTIARQIIEETGKRLANFAETLNIPFSFKVVMVSDMKDLREDMFDTKPDEAIAVYAPFSLRCMLCRPDRLETLMGVIRKLKPATMVVHEVEANLNSPSFVNRFVEALFFYGASFDCLDACMDRKDSNRMIIEAMYYNEGIQNVVGAEGVERLSRYVRLNVWRAFFARYGMVEKELSQSSLYQANLVLERFTCGSSCTLEMNGKSLIAGWKGTPLYSLSVWKFL